MSALQVSTVVIECDGCGLRYGIGDALRSAMEARAAAYGNGWRYPPMVDFKGNPGAMTNDVCPTCITEWTPKRKHGRDSGRSVKVGDVL